MRIRIAVPDAHVTPEVLNAALETTTRANHAMLEAGDVPPVSELIRQGAVRWKPEPFTDGEHFDLLPDVAARGWGDCDDLAPALAAELRATGRDPGARAFVRKSGPKRWHALVKTSDGETIDPSAAAGMYEEQARRRGGSVSGAGDAPGVYGAVMPTMAERCGIGIKRAKGRWAARCDLPFAGLPVAICGVAFGDTASEAIAEAIDSATVVGVSSEAVDMHDIARALAIQSAVSGHDFYDVAEELDGYLGEEELGSIFSSIAHGLKSIVPAAASFIPIPGAGLAAKLATGLIPGGGGGGHHGGQAIPAGAAPGFAASMPLPHEPPAIIHPSGQHGPIIIKF